MVVATIVAFWLVLGVEADGTLAWYIGSSGVSRHVFKIDDPATVEAVVARRSAAAADVALLQDELDSLAKAWRRARRQGAEARDAARAAYDAKLEELNSVKAETSVIALIQAASAAPWRQDLDAFYLAQRQWELKRNNARRLRLGLERKRCRI